MALIDILIAYMRSNDVTTTTGELLRLIGDVRELEVVE